LDSIAEREQTADLPVCIAGMQRDDVRTHGEKRPMTYTLLSKMEQNTKTKKHLGDLQIEGTILHLAPADSAGLDDNGKQINTCPWASPGCRAVCLYTAGHAGVYPTINEARIRKTRLFANARAAFMYALVADLETQVKRAEKHGRKPVCRPNGTSDVMFENIPVTRNGTEYPHIFAAFPEIQFYDYTKGIVRLKRCKDIPNYALTFSLSESNDRHAQTALELGYNVAAVVKDAGDTWAGCPVISGDEHDFRFMDPKGGNIIALTPKGKARKDDSGFVRPADGSLDTSRPVTFATQRSN
jgi:hypothetical protein